MSRTLTTGETALARSVFGEALDCSKVRIFTHPLGPWAIAFGSHLAFPAANPPPPDVSKAPWRMQAWLIHELTHAWQFQTKPLGTLASWAATLATGGYGPGLPGYRYAAPLKPWKAYNLEQQASLVEHAFMLHRTGRCEASPVGLEQLRGCIPFEI